MFTASRDLVIPAPRIRMEIFTTTSEYGSPSPQKSTALNFFLLFLLAAMLRPPHFSGLLVRARCITHHTAHRGEQEPGPEKGSQSGNRSRTEPSYLCLGDPFSEVLLAGWVVVRAPA